MLRAMAAAGAKDASQVTGQTQAIVSGVLIARREARRKRGVNEDGGITDPSLLVRLTPELTCGRIQYERGHSWRNSLNRPSGSAYVSQPL